LRHRLDEFPRTLVIVAALNFLYFGIEFTAAAVIGSVSLFADSFDFLEDTALNVLILIAMRWPAPSRNAVGKLLAAILLAGLATSATDSIWPDLIVGVGIAAMNADAAFLDPSMKVLGMALVPEMPRC
jgi:Co/Zn/Cd efflux system component